MNTTFNAAYEAKAKKHLSSVIRYCNKTMCIDTWLIELKQEGYTSEVKEVPAVEYFFKLHNHETRNTNNKPTRVHISGRF
jgi:hypothetical protein